MAIGSDDDQEESVAVEIFVSSLTLKVSSFITDTKSYNVSFVSQSSQRDRETHYDQIQGRGRGESENGKIRFD